MPRVAHCDVRRILLDSDPRVDRHRFAHEESPWPARWIAHPSCTGTTESVVVAFRRRFNFNDARRMRLHVTADQRYELFLDGRRIGRGPERGDHLNWFYETYEVDFPAGDHLLVARTWWLTDEAPSPYAQVTTRPGFLLLAESVELADQPVDDELTTGVADWQCKWLTGYTFVAPPDLNAFLVAGARIRIDGAAFAWDFQHGEGNDWVASRPVAKAAIKSIAAESAASWLLRPSVLPAMLDVPRVQPVCRFVEAPENSEVHARTIDLKNNLPADVDAWSKLLAGTDRLSIPPRSCRRIILDFEDYVCGYLELLTTGGMGATIHTGWAESLFIEKGTWKKDNRHTIEGKFFLGMGDSFVLDGGDQDRLFEPLWWQAGRYLQLTITTAEESLKIKSIVLRETGYPHRFESKFTSSEPRLEQVIRPALRTLQMCSHETYMDCPYYEQLQYVGDTRLQALVTYANTRDDRLARKAIEMFDASRACGNSGLTMARHPCRILQTIPPFSLYWIAMVHDHLMWRGNLSFVRARLPGVRAVVDAFAASLTSDDLIQSSTGWNFVDWVPGWFHGMPTDAERGVNGTINFHTVYTLRLAAELERFAGEPELAARNDRLADRIAAAANCFFEPTRGLFAEDRARTAFSEHTQCFALLGRGIVNGKRPHVADALLRDPNLSRATIYFSHYLFEVYRELGRIDRLVDRMSVWFEQARNGNVTTSEMPEPTRSDCHAWGAHPVFHYLATMLGIRPGAPGFATVSIQPQLGPLGFARGTMIHPRGEISVDVRATGTTLQGEVKLPKGVGGTLLVNGAKVPLPSDGAIFRFGEDTQ
jgi:hypothetical protein